MKRATAGIMTGAGALAAAFFAWLDYSCSQENISVSPAKDDSDKEYVVQPEDGCNIGSLDKAVKREDEISARVDTSDLEPQNPLGMPDLEYEMLQDYIANFVEGYKAGDVIDSDNHDRWTSIRLKEFIDSTPDKGWEQMTEHVWRSVIPVIYEKELAGLNDATVCDQMSILNGLAGLYRSYVDKPWLSDEAKKEFSDIPERLKQEVSSRMYEWLNQWEIEMAQEDPDFRKLGFGVRSRGWRYNDIGYMFHNLENYGFIGEDNLERIQDRIKEALNK